MNITLEQKQEMMQDEVMPQDNWAALVHHEGRLAVDIYRTGKKLFVRALIAGVCLDDIEISLQADMLTIQGKRKESKVKVDEQIYSEVFWGDFKRAIILPYHVKSSGVRAKFKNGILLISLPIEEEEKIIRITE